MNDKHDGYQANTMTSRDFWEIVLGALHAIFFLLPFLILGWGNRFDNEGKTGLRFAISFFAVWACLVAGIIFEYHIVLTILFPDGEGLPDNAYDGKELFVAIFLGWLVSGTLTFIAWLLLEGAYALRRFWQARRRAQGTNISSTKTNSSDNTAM